MSTVISDKNVPWEDLIIRRETYPLVKFEKNATYPDVKWDFGIIYDQGGNVLAHSRSASKDTTIRLLYKGFIFILTPGTDGNGEVYVDWPSMVKTVMNT